MCIDTRKWKVVKKRNFDYEVNGLAWTPDAKNLYLASGLGEPLPSRGHFLHLESCSHTRDAGSVLVLDRFSLKEATRLKAHTSIVICLAFSPDGR